MELTLGLNIFLGFCMFVIGSLFGSFFSLATYRIPRKQDIVATRSYCPNCKHRLNFFDLIPVFSYIIRGAKCHYCGQKISPRYFLLEFCNGVFFVILFCIFGYTLKLALVILIYAVIFVLIGAKIMDGKMTNEEREEINSKKLSKKSGVFISELVIALGLFIITFLTIIFINRNTSKKVEDVLIESNANNVLIKNIETCLGVEYDLLNSYSDTQTINGTKYDIQTTVESLANDSSLKKDIVKKINVKVSYYEGGKYQVMEMSTLKGKVTNE